MSEAFAFIIGFYLGSFLTTLCIFWKIKGLNALLRAREIEVETLNQLKPKEMVEIPTWLKKYREIQNEEQNRK